MHIEPDTLPTGHTGIAARLKKGPTIHSSAWVVPGATVIGDVTLEEESSVWYGAVLRGDINRIIIGPRSNVQDNAVVHLDTDYPTVVGELVTIGHNAIVHACKIDNEVLVGMGSIVLDDVEIGARSIIGANALITGGMKVPPGSGYASRRDLSPGAVIRRRNAIRRHAPLSSSNYPMEGGASGFASRGEGGCVGRRSNKRRAIRGALSVS